MSTQPTNQHTYPMKYTLAETKARVAAYGYTATHKDGEIEIRPRGSKEPGYFTNDRADAIATARLLATAAFKAKVDTLPELVAGRPVPAETRQALVAWFADHGTKWAEELGTAWMYSRYGYNHDSGALQQLRNNNGHKVLALLTA